MINTQMGLSSAMVMDPTSNSQTSILSRIITLLGILIFIELGGFYWLINALMRSFDESSESFFFVTVPCFLHVG